MLTLKQLLLATKNHRTKINATAAFLLRKTAPLPFANALAFQGRFAALTDKKRAYYDTTIIFHGVNYSQNKSMTFMLKADLLPGQAIYAERPSLNNTLAQVTCTCLDYYYTWWFYNDQQGSLAGEKFPAYTRKTTHYPERNPEHTAGLCKHLSRMTAELANKGFLTR